VTPHEFVTKWQGVELKERSASQSHFNDLCALLGILDPVSADPQGEWFTFEKGASKTGGGEGWADVWRKSCFAWEYKGKHANLQKAFAQLQQYAVALENPPLLITSDMNLIKVHTNWTNTVQEVHEFALDDLLDGTKRDRLKQAFLDPESFKPQKTRQALTEETAREFAGLAQRLRERGHEAHRVAHFVNQLVFCMFAEDAGLLPDHIFTKMLEVSRRDPRGFTENAATLFGAMAQKNGKVGFTAIDWFNGGLFTDDHVLPVSSDDIEDLISAARRDWSQIDPSILGTLFERGLDPAKRSQLGAHYTDREKIMMIVRPVIIEPLKAEWAEALGRITSLIENAPETTKEKLLRGPELAKRTKALSEAEAIHQAFIDRLANFRVLDPACGSGNFLYVALRALKDIEHRANLDAEALGLHRSFPRVGPECVLGIELNPYAAELARVSVWIGEIQWMRRNGFDAAKNPILRPLDTIECRDAVLNEDGTRANWPHADVVIGNPPFLGAAKHLRALGDTYAAQMRAAYKGLVPESADLVCYWFAQCLSASDRLRAAGLVASNSIRSSSSNIPVQAFARRFHLFAAWADLPWVVEGAAVRVSIVCGSVELHNIKQLDGRTAEHISANLKAEAFAPSKFPAQKSVIFRGPPKIGPFDIPGNVARAWLRQPVNPNGRPNADVLRPLWIANDVVRRPSDRWIIDFASMSEREAELFETPFTYTGEHVRPIRQANRRPVRRHNWWLHGETIPALRRAMSICERVIVTPMVSKHRVFVWMPVSVLPDQRLMVISRDDYVTFGVLHSKFHDVWTLATCSWHGAGNDPVYNAGSVFETFPFPEGLTPDTPPSDYADDPRGQKISAAAARLNELRENWLNPPDLVVREPEVVPGYPDRILPKDEEAAKELKRRTLTNLYNQRPQWLANAHAALDEVVAEAYGWGDDWRTGLLTDAEILVRLFRLNQERASKDAK
jgi:type II restriction/modification system DNA methylase subunit YeeA